MFHFLGVIRADVPSVSVGILGLLLLAGPALAQETANQHPVFALPPVVSAPTQTTYQFPDSRTRFRHYARDSFGPGALVSSAISSGFDQANNRPPEWRQGAKGYGKRFASRFGQNAIQETAQYGLSEALKQDAAYYKCECKGFLPRFKHALVSGVTARNREGKRVFSAPKVVSPYIAGFTATATWYPDRFGPKDGFRLGNLNLVSNFTSNLFREFFFR